MPSLTGSLSQQPEMHRSVLADALTVSDHVRRRYDALWPAMEQFYRAGAAALSDPELLVAIDVTFGPRLIHEVCVPLGFFDAACAFVGLVLLRQLDDEPQDRREPEDEAPSASRRV